jgi:hypothetical protein
MHFNTLSFSPYELLVSLRLISISHQKRSNRRLLSLYQTWPKFPIESMIYSNKLEWSTNPLVIKIGYLHSVSLVTEFGFTWTNKGSRIKNSISSNLSTMVHITSCSKRVPMPLRLDLVGFWLLQLVLLGRRHMSTEGDSLQDGCAMWERFPYKPMKDSLCLWCLAYFIFGQRKIMTDSMKIMKDSSDTVMATLWGIPYTIMTTLWGIPYTIMT